MFVFSSMKSSPCVCYFTARSMTGTRTARINRRITTVISHSRHEVAHAQTQGRSRDNKMCVNKNDLFNKSLRTGPAGC